MDWDCDGTSPVVTAALACIPALLWSLSAARCLSPAPKPEPARLSGRLLHSQAHGAGAAEDDKEAKRPFAIPAAPPVACFCLGRSLPLPALLGGDFTSSDTNTRDSRDRMLQPGAPGPSQHLTPFGASTHETETKS